MTAVLYTDGNQECERIRMLLSSLGGEFLEYGLGEHFTHTQFVSEFGSDATYPQVTIDGKHVGSLKETLHFFQDASVL
jgi:hypothetical protein